MKDFINSCTDKNVVIFGTVLATTMQVADMKKGRNEESDSKITSNESAYF